MMGKPRFAGVGGGKGGVRGRWTPGPAGAGGGGGGTAKGGAGRKRPRPPNAAVDEKAGAARGAEGDDDWEFLVAEYDSGAEGGAGRGRDRESSDEEEGDGEKGGWHGGKGLGDGDEEEDWGDLGLRQVCSRFHVLSRCREASLCVCFALCYRCFC